MGTMISSGNDVVTFLKQQHRQVKALLEEVGATRGQARARAFLSLRRMLAIHETAEEEVVHPAARRALPDGEKVITARLHEENEAKTALTELEKIDVDSIEFEAAFRTLKANVIAHAESEEREEFERMGSLLDAPRLERMRKAVEFAEAVAPTHPHAGIESATANILAGPFASMLDRARDLLSGKTAEERR